MNAAKSQWGYTFHHGGGVEDDSDVYVDLGENLVKELECILSEKCNEGRKAGIS